ncbi:MAG: hypothetical protein ACKOH9_04890 [Actinomycetota bacterium]
MRLSLKIVVSAALAFALTVPQASAEPTNHPSSSYVQKKDKKMKIEAVAKGDCAQNPTTILITDSTTTCSIEISVTPPKQYADVFLAVYRSTNSWSSPGYLTVSRVIKSGENASMIFSNLKTSAKGLATVGVLKTRTYVDYDAGFVITSATETLTATVTDAKVHGKGFFNSAKSNPIVVTFQQSIPASGCDYTYIDKYWTFYPCP